MEKCIKTVSINFIKSPCTHCNVMMRLRLINIQNETILHQES